MVKSKLSSDFESQHQVQEKFPSQGASWTIADSKALYGIEEWGAGYFSINTAGNITVTPQGDSRGIALDLYDLVESLKQRGIQLPLLIRFPDILADRLERLDHCLHRAIARYHYGGSYQEVFPIFL